MIERRSPEIAFVVSSIECSRCANIRGPCPNWPRSPTYRNTIFYGCSSPCCEKPAATSCREFASNTLPNGLSSIVISRLPRYYDGSSQALPQASRSRFLTAPSDFRRANVYGMTGLETRAELDRTSSKDIHAVHETVRVIEQPSFRIAYIRHLGPDGAAELNA